MKIGTIASGLTHLLFASLIGLAAAKHAHQSDPADAGSLGKSVAVQAQSVQTGRSAAENAGTREAQTEETSGPAGADTLAPADRALDAQASQGTLPGVEPQPIARAPAPAASDAPVQPSEAATLAPESPDAPLMRRLVAAYPDFLIGYEGNEIIWRDGTRMTFDDGREKTFMERLSAPALKDQFYTEYPRGLRGVPPDQNIDPGRVRYEPFFTKMYGNCKQDPRGVEARLEDVVWLPENWGKTVRVTRVNGVADALRKVSAELDRLPRRFMKYLRPSAGAYHCRTIAGTERFSVHAFGAAVDINAKYGDYWRWSNPRSDTPLAHRNQIPWEIVEIFERHGFIWGGKWYHYDTLHFEYRPELLNAASRDLVSSPAPSLPERRRQGGQSAAR